MEHKPFQRAFWIIVLAAILLLAYPVLHRQIPLLQTHFRAYSPLLPLLRDTTTLNNSNTDSATPNTDSIDLNTDRVNPKTDTTITTAAAATDTIQEEVAPPLLPAELSTFNGRQYLLPFYRSLPPGNEQLRIAHYGDSSIEGDLITATFRDSLQSRFGGAGVGFVPLVNPIAGFRRSVIHSFSEHWHHQPLERKNRQKLPRGIAGAYTSSWQPTMETDSLASDLPFKDTTVSYWSSYRTAKLFPGTRSFPQSRLFYASPVSDRSTLDRPSPRVYVKTGDQQRWLPLEGSAPANQLWLSRDTVQRIYLRFETPPSMALYGLSFESSDGIIVDNFPSRGNSGSAIRYISVPVLRSFQEMLDYDLVMLQFGLNVLNPGMTNYSWYEREIGKVIAHLRQAMPEASFLILGPSDRAIRYRGKLQTDPSVPRITRALRRVAAREKVAFFSFYEAMGGKGSMIRWVNDENPRLANLDYTHFNFKGARLAATFLLEFLLDGYEQYKRGELVAEPAESQLSGSAGEVSESEQQKPGQ